MVKIRFVETPTPSQMEAGSKFKRGQTIDLPFASAQHWLTRNVAVLVLEDEGAVKVEQAAKPEESDDAPKRGRGRPPKEA